MHLQPGGQSVQDCIEALYCVFANYQFTDPEPGRYADIMPQLLGPIRVVPLNALERYLTTLISIYGDNGESIRHFLPRLCELLYSECSRGHYYSSMSTQFVMGGLYRCKWRTWPKEEINAIEGFIHAWWAELITIEPELSKLKKEQHQPPLYFGDGWAGINNHPYDFLDDLEHLQDRIDNELKELWSEAINADESIGPITHLAAVYVNQHGMFHNDPDRVDKLGDWYKQPDRCKALYASWVKHQDQEPLGSFFSDAHAIAELLCSD